MLMIFILKNILNEIIGFSKKRINERIWTAAAFYITSIET